MSSSETLEVGARNCKSYYPVEMSRAGEWLQLGLKPTFESGLTMKSQAGPFEAGPTLGTQAGP